MHTISGPGLGKAKAVRRAVRPLKWRQWKLSFSARVLSWLGYFTFAVLWICLTVLWVIEAGRPYP